METILLKNGESVALEKIPELDYRTFSDQVISLLSNAECHCLNYYAYRENDKHLRFLCCIANDTTSFIHVFSYLHTLTDTGSLQSITPAVTGLQCFEREITENFGITFNGQPWDKPLRYPHNRADRNSIIENYPFYSISGHQLHEVGVGPIHAGIIEPGHFRFICNGEKILHLEIQLGYQHRGVEQLMLQKKSALERTLLAESIAGDSVAANTAAYAMVSESLSGIDIADAISLERCIAIELERAAIHTGDLSALCTDIAYQQGSAVFQGLRTTLINTFLGWCGNRFARRLIRPFHNPFPLNNERINNIADNIDLFEPRFDEMANYLFNNPGVLARFDDAGHVSHEQALQIQAVGMAARTCGLARDTRKSHPYGAFTKIEHNPVCLDSGDVHARALLRRLEVTQSLDYIRDMLEMHHENVIPKVPNPSFRSSTFTIAVTEGWRGEHVHCALTDDSGQLRHYKIKDPSIHNWMALALAVRKNDISEFPVCNKSFNLSYCGYDL